MFRPDLRRRGLVYVTTGALAVASTGCELNIATEGITATETQTFEVSGQPDVILETFDGAIEVRSWDRDTVEIEIERRAMEQNILDEIKISAQNDGNRVTLKVTGPPRERFRGITVGHNISPTARLRVAMPRTGNLQASSGDGAITVEDVNGRITLDTSDGSVRAARIGGDIRVRTGDGTIRMERVEGRLDVETSDGGITLEGKPSVLRGRTGDGAIRLNIGLDTVMAEDWDLTTGDGSITLTLPPGFNAELDAESGDGSVRASHPGIRVEDRNSNGDREERRRRSLRTTMGSGGKMFRVRTSDGSVRIES